MTLTLDVLTRHHALPEGTAAGRAAHALGDGLTALGVDVRMLCWSPAPPAAELPAWAVWTPLPGEPAWRRRGRALAHPRGDTVLLADRLRPGAAALAEDAVSAGAVRRAARAGMPAAVTVHYDPQLDAAAVGAGSLAERARRWQDRRHREQLHPTRLGPRGAPALLAYSDRVAAAVGTRAVVPFPLAVPTEPLPAVEAPVAALLADWDWPPNRVALDTLLRAWPEVAARVPGARLLLAGRGRLELGTGLPGVLAVGPVADAAGFLARAAVLAFPCPPSSGPKTKVLEAVLAGLPVVTTPAGVEGLAVGGGVTVAPRHRFAAALAAALADPAARAAGAAAARATAAAVHAPVPAARARLAAWGLPLPA
jgi:hypothetical protein